MKKPASTPAASVAAAAPSPGQTVLDWPREAGLADEFMARVEIRLQRKKRQRRRLLSGGAALVAFAAALLWAVPYARHTATVETVAARRQTLALADGSQAELNARTSLWTDFRYGRRIVRLDRGEAFFAVAKDPAHPFLVETPAGTIRVTGTQFNVRVTETGAAEVTLLEGSVSVLTETQKPETGNLKPETGSTDTQNSVLRSQVSGPDSGLRSQVSGFSTVALVPGQQFNTAQAEVRTLSPADLDNALAWRTGRLALDGLTLAEAAARLAAYHGIQIEVAPEVAGLRPGGTYTVENLDNFLRAFENALTVKVLPRGDGSYLIIARP